MPAEVVGIGPEVRVIPQLFFFKTMRLTLVDYSGGAFGDQHVCWVDVRGTA